MMAEEVGLRPNDPEYWVWMNRPTQNEIWAEAVKEYSAMRREAGRRTGKPGPVWYQLVVTSAPVEVVPPTKFGVNPFDEDVDGAYRCPDGHVSGLNLLSDVHVRRDAWDGSDIARTRELVGMRWPAGSRHGVRAPAPLLLISPRLRELMNKNKIRGYRTEVAYLCP
jgi:hypothetical protein